MIANGSIDIHAYGENRYNATQALDADEGSANIYIYTYRYIQYNILQYSTVQYRKRMKLNNLYRNEFHKS